MFSYYTNSQVLDVYVIETFTNSVSKYLCYKTEYNCLYTDYQEPYAVVALLEKDLVVIDLTQTGYADAQEWFKRKKRSTSDCKNDYIDILPCRYPIFENPYPLTIHESPVTCCEYFADCPDELIPALYSVGSRQKRQGYSKKVSVCACVSPVICTKTVYSVLKSEIFFPGMAYKWW